MKIIRTPKYHWCDHHNNFSTYAINIAENDIESGKLKPSYFEYMNGEDFCPCGIMCQDCHVSVGHRCHNDGKLMIGKFHSSRISGFLHEYEQREDIPHFGEDDA